MSFRPTVLLTDYAWPDVTLETGIIEGAGFRLVTGPPKPLPPRSSPAWRPSTSPPRS